MPNGSKPKRPGRPAGAKRPPAENMIVVRFTITPDQREWLQSELGPVNASAWLRQVIDREREEALKE